MSRPPSHGGRGPFRADQVRSGDPYELTQGHPIFCAPTGHEGAASNSLGAAVLGSDPAVKRAGVDAGIALAEDTLRAPDVAVNFEPGEGTWAKSAPLVVEYAGVGQDEASLREKIEEFHAAGTRWVWVVRLVGARRVEVHERGEAMRVVDADSTLTAPGVLALPVPARALFDPDAAHEVTLRNLLSRKGYDSLDALRAEARRGGRKEGLDAGLRPLEHLFSRRLGRALSAAEHGELLRRLGTLGPARLGDVVLDLTPDALAAWLADPDAA
jgi:hypothetical protein